MFRKVAFTMYPVKDPKRARAFYEDTLGLAVGSLSSKENIDDLDTLTARLKSKGVRFKAENIQSPVCRMAVILDSEGNAVILHELKKRDRNAG
jgi:predicted enzyme related to lactoylglutathione lyase